MKKKKMTYKIKELDENIRPRERLLKYGVSSLSNDELLAIILRTGTKDLNAKDLANNILNKVKSINNLSNISLQELSSIKGIGKVKAITLIASLELGKRCLTKDVSKIKIDNNKIIYDLFKYEFINCYQEKFIALFLDIKNNLIDYNVIFMGTVSSSIIHPREIFKLAFKYSASSIIIVHNHPSGDSNPSNEDIIITDKLFEIGKIMSIPILDHVIIGYKNYYSFYDKRKIDIYE